MDKIGYARVIEKRFAMIKATVCTQFFAMALVLFFSLLFYNISIACSVFTGSLCSVIPSVYFSYRTLLYKNRIEGNPKKFLTNFVAAEGIKFLLIVSMLVAACRLTEVVESLSPAGMIVGFIITYLSVLLTPFVIKLLASDKN